MQALAQQMTLLRSLLPSINVSKLAATYPSLLLDYSPQDLTDRLSNLRHAHSSLLSDLCPQPYSQTVKVASAGDIHRIDIALRSSRQRWTSLSWQR